MYELNGITYADDSNKIGTIRAIGCKVLDNYCLLLTFSNHEKKFTMLVNCYNILLFNL